MKHQFTIFVSFKTDTRPLGLRYAKHSTELLFNSFSQFYYNVNTVELTWICVDFHSICTKNTYVIKESQFLVPASVQTAGTSTYHWRALPKRLCSPCRNYGRQEVDASMATSPLGQECHQPLAVCHMT